MKIDEKLETLQRLVKVPNVDDNPKESLRAMKMLNLILDIRLKLQLLQSTNFNESVKSNISDLLPLDEEIYDKSITEAKKSYDDKTLLFHAFKEGFGSGVNWIIEQIEENVKINKF